MTESLTLAPAVDAAGFTLAEIGDPDRPAAVRRLPGTTMLAAAGANLWGSADEGGMLARTAAGDFDLTATLELVGAGVDPHRKAGLMARATLEPDAAYVDVVLHGDGLLALQYRTTPGGPTEEVRGLATGGRRLELRRRGPWFSAWADGAPIAGSVRCELPDDLVVGAVVCSHRPEVVEVAAFVDLRLDPPGAGDRLFSVLETIGRDGGDRRTVRVFDRWMEAPNRLGDGRFVFNSDGAMHLLSADGRIETRIDTGDAIGCNNDHGPSPDGALLAISDASDGLSRVLIVPIDGGEPRLVTPQRPSYWHGWSPDGARLAFCGERDGAWGVFTIRTDGSDERRLTSAPGLDDGPDYSPDGRWIYFNSDRTGRMQLFRVPAEGGDVEPVAPSATADWFPHVAPDGAALVHVAFPAHVRDHPRDQEVSLQLVDLTTGERRRLVDLFGGQGTMNVPSWAPDGDRIAFVSYVYG